MRPALTNVGYVEVGRTQRGRLPEGRVFASGV